MELLFDNLQILNQEFGDKLVEFVAATFKDENEMSVDTNWFLLHVNRIAGLPAFYVLTPEGVVVGALNYDHELQIDTVSYDELIDGDEDFSGIIDAADKIKAIIENEAKDEKDYQLLQQVEDAVIRSTYAWLLTNWYEPQAENAKNGNPEQAHQMIFADLMVLDEELSSMIDFMSEKDPDRTFNIVADMIAHNGLDNPEED